MARSSLSTLFLAFLASLGAEAEPGHKLRHAEESVVVLADQPEAATDEAADVMVPTISADSSSEIKLVSSMAALWDDEDQETDPASPKSKIERKLVALVWLERILQANLDTLDEKAYGEKIAKGRAGLERDTTPATAEMLTRMRLEMHEFSAPFYRNAVRDELTRIRQRQKVLLDQLIALDAGKPVDDSEESASLEEQGEESSPAPPAESASTTKKAEAPKKTGKKKMTAQELKEREERRAQQNMFVLIMSGILCALIGIVVAIAIKVKTHVRAGD